MENDWKSDIGLYFAKNNVFRLKYLNDHLESSCNEYVSYLKEFERVSASVRSERYNGKLHDSFEGSIYGKLITTDMRAINPVFREFKLSCFFNAPSHLIMKSAIDCDLLMNIEDPKAYEYMEEEFTEPETLEKTYIFALFNSRLIRYIETLKKKLNG